LSQENVEAFKRVFEALNRRDIESLLERYDPDVEARYALESLLGGEAVVHRGHEGVREAFQAYSDTMASFRYEFSEFRDLGDRVVAIGRFRTRGRKSGVPAESPIAYVVDFKDGKDSKSELPRSRACPPSRRATGVGVDQLDGRSIKERLGRIEQRGAYTATGVDADDPRPTPSPHRLLVRLPRSD
jgi:ketosteroid isomerase-like protein